MVRRGDDLGVGSVARRAKRSGAARALVLAAAVFAVAAVGAGCSSSEESAGAADAGAQGAGAVVGAKHGEEGADEHGAAAARGAVGATEEPGEAPAAAPEETRLAPDESQPPLPDGTFTGRFQGEDAAVSVRLVVRDGMVLVAHVEVVGKRRTSLELRPVVASDARTLRFQGRFGEDYLRLKGRFVDDRRATGTFEGQVDRKRVSGRWYALRR